MAERRMFAKTIIDSDAFLEMPATTQNLYFHFGMRADDDGFVNNPKSIMRTVGAKDDDTNVLIAKKLILPFESGVIVIKHWRVNNYLRSDRYTATKYKGERAMLGVDENNSYTMANGIPPVYQLDGSPDTQVRSGQDSKGKVKKKESKTASGDFTFNDIINNFTQHQPLRDALCEFLQIRKLIKAPLTNSSLQKLLTNQKTGLFDLCGGDNVLATEIVNQSITNSWRSFFPLRETKKQGQGDSENFVDRLARV